QVTLPVGLDSGTYYIIPWADSYTNVAQDELATNINPDDPNEIQNDNYKARAIDIIGALPDLVVTTVQPTLKAVGGDDYTVTWTVQNQSTVAATQAGWFDRVYLAPLPDVLAPQAKSYILGEVQHTDPLKPGESYTATLKVHLAPSAAGLYAVVVADDQTDEQRSDKYHNLKELREDNNETASPTQVTPVPADLVVTHFDIPA